MCERVYALQGDDPDPSDPAFHSAKGVWAVEPLDRRYSQVIR